MSRQSQRLRNPVPVHGQWGMVILLALVALLLLIPGLPASLTIAAGAIGLLLLSARADVESRRRRSFPDD